MKKVISIWLRNFFGFSRTEANGFIILSLFMIMILILPIITKNYFLYIQSDLQTQNDRDELNALLEKLDKNSRFKQPKIQETYPALPSFDLNLSDSKQLEKAGFPTFLANRVVKYRETIQPFNTKSDLLKIYGIDSGFYNKVYPRMSITKVSVKQDKAEETIEPKKAYPEPSKPKRMEIEPFSINKADTMELMKIYGIGPAYSSRIIKYREYLGGFHSLQQLQEVYGLKKENIDSLEKYIFLEEKLTLRQLKINALTADSLVRHPYISYKEANLLVNYRNQHGNYDSIEDLLAIKILDGTWVKKIAPYISFD